MIRIIVLACLSVCAVLPSHAQTTVLFEDFEDSSIQYTTSINEASDGSYDYFGRVAADGISVGSGVVFNNYQGSGFFAAQDMDASGEPAAPGAEASLVWSGLDVSGLRNLSFSAYFAEDDSSDGKEDWDSADDYLLVEYRIDGGAWQNLLRFENNGSTYNTVPQEDTDFNGIGDGAEITSSFTQFSKSIPLTGTTLDLRMTIDLNAGDEDIAFDNVEIVGEGGGAALVDNVSSFAATSAGAGLIDLSWIPNTNGDSVVVARSTNDVFGVPETGSAYSAGGTIPGGGTVVYAGAGTAHRDSGLTADGGYFYKAWAVDSAANYSSGVSSFALAGAYREGIRIIHVNDVHSRLTPHDYDITGTNDVPVLEKVGGAAYAAAKMLELKAAHPGAVVVDAGDTSEGSILGDLRSNGGVIDFYKELDRKLELLGGRGIDASVVGNHDVRYAEMLTNMRACTNFPFISMNIIELATGEPYFEPYVTVVADGKKVGILGYTTDTSAYLGPETDALIRVDTCGWDEGDILVKDYVDHLRNNEHCDVVILLVHVGHSRVASNDAGDNEYQLVKDDGVTVPPEVVIGGHWHTMTETVWQPAILNYKTIIAEAASYLQYIGEIALADDGSYLDSWKHVVRNADIEPDADIQAVVDDLKAEYDASPNKEHDLDEVIGYSAVDLRLNKNKWWTHNEFPWAGDNTAGAWISDSMQWYVDTQTTNGCDLALQSGGGVRRDNAAGPITYLEIYETYPWQDDNMVLIDALGSEIWDFIQEDYVGTSISQGWEIYAHDGIITNITRNGVAIDPDATYRIVVSDYMYSHDNDFAAGGWSDSTPIALDYSIRQSVIDYTSQFGESNPMDVPGPRYHLNTGHSGRFQAVVTMADDSDVYGSRQPYHEAVFVRLLSATADTVARRGGYASAELVNADGSINPAHQFSESMLYRSYLGFKEGVLAPGTILNIQVESGFHGGNPQLVEQSGILADGVEFDIVGTNLSLALPDYKGSIDGFWDEWHENHYVVFEGEKVGDSQIKDRKGQTISVYTEGAYDLMSLPGAIGDHLELKGLQTYRFTERRFRCAAATVVESAPAEIDYAPYSSVDAIGSNLQSASPLVLSASASDTTEETYLRLLPTDDTQVADGHPDYTFGSASTLYLQSASTAASGYGDERLWAKFNLSTLPEGASIESATLRFYCWDNYNASSDMTADVHACSDDSWSEDTLSWTLQPALGSVVASGTLDASEEYVWHEWDVAGYVETEAAGDGVASLVVKPRVEDASVRNAFKYDAKEYNDGSAGPFLEVEYSGGPVLGGTVANVAFFYRYSSDGLGWGAWTFAGNAAAEPWTLDFNYPEGHGWYEFHSVATDDTGNTEPAPVKADASVHFVADADGDGMDDDWEIAHFGNLGSADENSDNDADLMPDRYEFDHGFDPTSAATLATDSDGDGQGDIAEFDYGTDPNSSNDFFAAQAASSNAVFVLEFAAADGRRYVVQESESFETWHNGTVVDGSGEMVSVGYPATNDHRFFRVDGAVDRGAPVAKICVISDTHYLAPALLNTNSPDFQAYLAQDRKLIAESHDIMESAIAAIIAERPDVLLVSGDLTKDGELVCHQALSNYFAQVESAGIDVVVCPGNHDINNLHAVEYNSIGSVATASISPEQFAENYGHCGFGEALYSDPASLSFVVEPVSNLWILSVDSCKYIPSQTTGGYVKPETLDWIDGVLGDAAAKGKTVLAMMHHGVIPHYAYQTALFPEYVVDNYADVAETLINGGVGAVFTGHYHANDVIRDPSGKLFDIETGSTVTWPCPYRVVFMTADGVLNIETKVIEEIAGNPGFQSYAKDFLYEGLMGVSSNMLIYTYGVDPADAAAMAPAMTSTFMAHYAGDEGTPDDYTQYVLGVLASSTNAMDQLFGAAINSIWDDPAPADNDVLINTQTGGAAKK